MRVVRPVLEGLGQPLGFAAQVRLLLAPVLQRINSLRSDRAGVQAHQAVASVEEALV